ncbi:MAG: nuclear transport factor 2 family protein [Hyphomicrobiaceae bacterium]
MAKRLRLLPGHPIGFALLSLGLAFGPVVAQDLPSAHPLERWLPATSPLTGSRVNETSSPSNAEAANKEILILVRTSLLTLNDAMSTGNFSVLRDLIAPSVREQNTSGRLYQTFADLIAKGLDLRSVAIQEPKMKRPPEIGTDGRLRISGNFPGPSVSANFDITYEKVNARWRIYGLSLFLEPNRQTTESADKSPAEKKSAKSK